MEEKRGSNRPKGTCRPGKRMDQLYGPPRGLWLQRLSPAKDRIIIDDLIDRRAAQDVRDVFPAAAKHWIGFGIRQDHEHDGLAIELDCSPSPFFLLKMKTLPELRVRHR